MPMMKRGKTGFNEFLIANRHLSEKASHFVMQESNDCNLMPFVIAEMENRFSHSSSSPQQQHELYFPRVIVFQWFPYN